MISNRAKLWWEPLHPEGRSWRLCSKEESGTTWVVGIVSASIVYTFDRYNVAKVNRIPLPGNNMRANADILLEAVEKVIASHERDCASRIPPV